MLKGCPYTNAILGGDDEVVGQLICVLLDHSLYNSYLVCRSFIGKTQQQNAGMAPVIPKHFFSEVLIVGHQDTSLGQCPFDNLVVVCLRHLFANGYHVVAGLLQVSGYRLARGFIYQEL
jgi:hypothetical protein